MPKGNRTSRRGHGPPAQYQGPVFYVRSTTEQAEDVRLAAERDGCAAAEWIRQAIEERLERRPGADPGGTCPRCGAPVPRER